MKKYELTDETINPLDNVTLHRIKALRDFGDVKEGDLGGYIQSEDNLSHHEGAWVSENAQVYENARVSGNAHVYGDARISGNAEVFGDARVHGGIVVCGGVNMNHPLPNGTLVYEASIEWTSVTKPCLLCGGTNQVTLVLHSEEQVKIPCACKTGEALVGWEHKVTATPRTLYLQGMELRGGKEVWRYWLHKSALTSGGGSLTDSSRPLFHTEQEALNSFTEEDVRRRQSKQIESNKQVEFRDIKINSAEYATHAIAELRHRISSLEAYRETQRV